MRDFKKYGFVEKEASYASRIGIIKEIIGQIYTLDKYNLVTSVHMKNILFVQDGERVIVKNDSGCTIANIAIEDMSGWAIKDYGDGEEEHVFSLGEHGVVYKMLIKECSVIELSH